MRNRRFRGDEGARDREPAFAAPDPTPTEALSAALAADLRPGGTGSICKELAVCAGP